MRGYDPPMRKTPAVLGVIGAAVISIVAAAPANAMPVWTVDPGSDIRYFWASDTVNNTISFYGTDGRLVTQRAQFVPTLINIGGGQRYHLEIRFTAPGTQYVAAAMHSDGSSAQCQVWDGGAKLADEYAPNTPRAIAYC